VTVLKSYVNFWGYMPFLTFEGIDGSGKSSLMKLLEENLKQRGLHVEITREPGGSNIGPELRSILLRTQGAAPCPEAELLIYEADRAQHVAFKIRPWLDQGIWVLSDRFSDSSVAFQGAGRKIKIEDVKWLNRFATAGLTPDVTVLMDCPIEVSQTRRQKREREEKVSADRFEREDKEFHQAVRDAYLSLAREEKERFIVLNAQKDPKSLLTDLLQALQKRGTRFENI